VPEARWRPVPKGAVNTPFRLETDGDYVLRTNVYGKTVDDEKLKITWSADGKALTTVEVEASSERKPQMVRFPVKLEPGEHRFAVKLENPSPGAEELATGTGGRRGQKQSQRNGEKPPPATLPADIRV